MIIRSADRLEKHVVNPMGGTGEITQQFIITADNAKDSSAFKTMAQVTLPPGAAIGHHVHQNDEEIYYIVSGHGLYMKNDGATFEVKAGDTTINYKGEKHGLQNTSSEPLIFLGIVAK